jgi:hypothetical protein
LTGQATPGSWTWSWMEPPLGHISFFLLCLQFARNQVPCPRTRHAALLPLRHLPTPPSALHTRLLLSKSMPIAYGAKVDSDSRPYDDKTKWRTLPTPAPHTTALFLPHRQMLNIGAKPYTGRLQAWRAKRSDAPPRAHIHPAIHTYTHCNTQRKRKREQEGE